MLGSFSTQHWTKRIDATGKKADISRDEARTKRVRSRVGSRDRQRPASDVRLADSGRNLQDGAMSRGMAMMMDRIYCTLMALCADDSGATAIEYALIITFISITVVSWATFVGTTISGFFTSIANGM
jgi:Flp pilus assembly pilin Flp